MEFDFLLQPRQVSFEWHLRQVRHWLLLDRGRYLDNVLVYASLELRAAIERYLFELFCLLKENDLTRKELEKCSKIGGIFALIKKNNEQIERTIEFTKIIASLEPGSPKLTFVDFAFLNKKWHALSSYCHKQYRPCETFGTRDRSFQKKGFALIDEIIHKLIDENGESNRSLVTESAKKTMPPEVLQIYDNFLAGDLCKEQVQARLELMKPILERRRSIGGALKAGT